MESADRMFEYLGYTKCESELLIEYAKPSVFDCMEVILFDKEIHDVEVLLVEPDGKEERASISPRMIFAINEKFTELGWAW